MEIIIISAIAFYSIWVIQKKVKAIKAGNCGCGGGSCAGCSGCSCNKQQTAAVKK